MPGTKIETRDSSSFSELIADVEEHNRNHGWGASLAKAIGGMVQATVEGKNPNLGEMQEEVAVDSAHSAQSGLTSLRAMHGATFDRFGLKPKQTESGQIMIKIAQAENLLRKIESLRETPQRDEDTEKMLDFLASSLHKQIWNAEYENLLPEDKNAIENLLPLIQAFRAANPKLDLAKLNTYARFQKEGRLANYVAVERENLWAEPGKDFGPADWVRDITPEHLEAKWKSALGILQVQETMHNSGVATELREHLLRCVASASETLKGLKPDYGYPQEDREQMQGVLERYTKTLRGNKVLN